MTKEQTHKVLYIVAFFATLTFIIGAHNSYYFLPIIKGYAAVKQILFFLYLLMLVLGAIFRWNIVLFLSVVYLLQTISGSLIPLWQSIFTNHFIFADIGDMPGYANALGNLLTTASAFAAFLGRLYGYWQERDSGQRSKF